MAYFQPFPVTVYDGVEMPQITTSTVIDQFSKDSFFDYTIEEGETPEMLAHRIYGRSDHAAFILLMNDIVDPYNEWPLSERELQHMASANYDNIYGIHHYENTAGNIVSINYPEYDRVPVTNLEFEINKNDSKRSIRLIHPTLMSTMVNEHKKLLRSANG